MSMKKRRAVRLRIRDYRFTELFVKVDLKLTVRETEARYAMATRVNLGSIRFTVKGRPLEQSKKILDLPPRILSGTQVIDVSAYLSCDRNCQSCLLYSTYSQRDNWSKGVK
jgi:hypothetical protein